MGRHIAWALLLWVPAMFLIRQFMPEEIEDEATKKAAGIMIFFGGLSVAIAAGILL